MRFLTMLFHEGEHRRKMAWAVREVDETVRRINERRAERGGRACVCAVCCEEGTQTEASNQESCKIMCFFWYFLLPPAIFSHERKRKRRKFQGFVR